MILGIATLALLQVAQYAAAAKSESTVVATPGPSYDAGWFRRLVFGKGWRSLWATPLRVPAVDLETSHGGLIAYDRAGSGQTPSLRFCNPAGQTYQFRAVDKSPGQHTSGFRRSPPVRWVYQDHISAMMPAGALAVSKLEEAAGIFPTERWLAVLPDSPRLGKWREEFRGMLGVFEFRHTQDAECRPELADREVIQSDTLFRRLRNDGLNQVDQRQYLTTRLLDLLINDSDRHEGQVRWISIEREGLHLWEAIPRDRDWAFSNSDGLAYDVARVVYPLWLEFSPNYGSLRGLTVKAEALDRRLLTGLEKRVWDSLAVALRSRLSDSVIHGAIEALPAEFARAELERFEQNLRSRRDRLPEVASAFYRRLRGVVDVRGSDQVEVVQATRHSDGSLDLELRTKGVVVYRRRFLPQETEEVRLHLLDGSDTVTLRGHAGGIPLRLITGAGSDLVIDSTGGARLRVYDDLGSATTRSTGAVHISRRPFQSPVSPDDPAALQRDFGAQMGIVTWFKIRPEIGVVLGAGPAMYRYGFRRVPYQSKVAVRAGTTTGVGRLNLDLKADFRFENPRWRVLLDAAALNADVIRYFGAGNETSRSAIPGFNNIVQRQYVLEPAVEWRFADNGWLTLGSILQWTRQYPERITLVSNERPYGSGSFTEAGFAAGIGLDTRDSRAIPSKGFTLKLAGRFFPAFFDVERAFASVQLEGTTYLAARAAPLQPTLALRTGGIRTFGRAPYFEAAAIGGRETFRGLTTRRFQGDAAVYGNLELRLNLGDVTAGSWGILGLADVGRVFVDGEHSGRWHRSLGGGLWFGYSRNTQVLTLTLAGAGEALKVYLQSGFHF